MREPFTKNQAVWASLCLLSLALPCLAQSGVEAHNPPPAVGREGRNGVSELLGAISAQFPGAIERDTNGVVIKIGIPSKYAHEDSLATLATLPAVTQVTVFGGSARSEKDSPVLTEQGISFLMSMTNLTEIELSCLHRLGEGVLKGLAKPSHLRGVRLYNVALPADEYKWIAYATNLSHVEIQNCRNFGNQQLLALTNLSVLNDLRLSGTTVSPEGVAAVGRMHALTNLNIQFSRQTRDFSEGEH